MCDERETNETILQKMYRNDGASIDATCNKIQTESYTESVIVNDTKGSQVTLPTNINHTRKILY